MITIGVDPGLTGAIGILQDGRYVAVEDMPTVLKGVGSVKREVSPSALIALLRERVPPADNVAAALERVNAMPGQGVSSVFSLGDSFGTARAVLSVARVELHYVVPASWKKHFKLPADKEAGRALAQRLFPLAPLHLKKHDGRAEALLIARWLHETRFA